MASVFDPVIRSQASQDPMIERPIQDTTTAPFVETAGKVVVELFRESAVEDLTGDARIAAEVEADASLLPAEGATEAEKEAAVSSINTLSQLAAARKAGLSIGQARTRATAILKRAVNENPLFAESIRTSYNKFFGGTGAGVFELTAEEKALEKYKEDVTTRSLQLGVTTEQAAQSIRTEQKNNLLKQEYELQAKERTLNGDSYVGYADINTQTTTDEIMRKALSIVRERGSLSPEDVQALKAEARLAGSTLKRQQGALLRDENGKPLLDMVNRESIAAANSLIDTQIDNVISLLDDQAALKLSADNYSIVNDKFNTAVIKNYGQFMATKNALGEQASALYFQKMLGNKEYAAVAQADPFVREILRAGDNFQKDFMGATASALGRAVGAGDQEVAAPVSNKEKAGWLGIIATDATKSAIKPLLNVEGNKVTQLTQEAIQASPLALGTFKKEVWRNRIKSDPAYLPVIESAMVGAAKAAQSKLVLDTGSFDMSGVRIIDVYAGIDNLSLPGDYRTIVMDKQPTSVINVVGDNISDSTREHIRLMFEVARDNPKVWEGKAESPIEYIRSLLKIRSPERAAPARQEAEEAPSSPTTQRQQPPQLDEFIEDSRRYQAGEVDQEYLLSKYPPRFIRDLFNERVAGETYMLDSEGKGDVR